MVCYMFNTCRITFSESRVQDTLHPSTCSSADVVQPQRFQANSNCITPSMEKQTETLNMSNSWYWMNYSNQFASFIKKELHTDKAIYWQHAMVSHTRTFYHKRKKKRNMLNLREQPTLDTIAKRLILCHLFL